MTHQPRTAPASDRSDGSSPVPRSVDLGVMVCLFALAFLARLLVAAVLELSSDSTDPVVHALRLLRGDDLLQAPSVLYGYGRGWSFVPLVVGTPGGYLGFGVRQAALQSLIAPGVYAGVRLLIGRQGHGMVLSPLLAALLPAFHQGLFETLRTGNQTYLAPEWGTVAALAVVAVLVGRGAAVGAVALGVALPMMALNHPFAAAAVGVVPVLMYVQYRRSGLRGLAPVGVLLVLAALLAVPHATFLDFAGKVELDAGVLAFVRGPGAVPLSLGDGASGFLASRSRPESALLMAAPGVALVLGVFARRRAEAAPRLALLGLASATCMGLGILLTQVPWYVMRYHWRPLIPLLAICVGGSLALGFQLASMPSLRGIRRAVAASALVSVLALVGHREWLGVQSWLRGEWDVSAEDRVRTASHHARLQRRLAAVAGDGPMILGTLQLGDYGATFEALGVVLDGVMDGVSPARYFTSWDDGVTAPQVLAVAGSPGRIADLLKPPWGPGIQVLDGGERHLWLRLDDAAAGRRWTRRLCEADIGRLRPWSWLDRSEEPHQVRGVAEYAHLVGAEAGRDRLLPFAHPCLGPDHWVWLKPGGYPFPHRGGDGSERARNFEFDGILIGRLEVTRRDWRRCVADGACDEAPAAVDEAAGDAESGAGGAEWGAEAAEPEAEAAAEDAWLPVVGVSADDAQAYCRWLGGDLPDEVQWEIAGGWAPDDADGWLLRPWGDDPEPGRAALGTGGLDPVGSYPAGRSWFGVEDLLGNAAEWVRTADLPGRAETPPGAFVIRGGSWRDAGRMDLHAVRVPSDEVPAPPDVGFRCVLPEAPE